MFRVDIHNAHVQPDGTYHYHGNPNALFDDSPSEDGSPLIGWAADGFPIYGSYILEVSTYQIDSLKTITQELGISAFPTYLLIDNGREIKITFNAFEEIENYLTEK